MKFVLATHNPNKIREMGAILGQFGVEVVSPKELGITVDVEETGSTFAENAMLKAKAICELAKLPAIADDSGLCVDALNGGPGVYSARYGGEGLDDKGRYTLLLQTMRGQTTRGGYSPEQEVERTLGQTCRSLGYDEIITYSFISPTYYDKIRWAKDAPRRKSMKIMNPLGEDTSIMRTTVLPSMLEILSRNYNYRNQAVRLYELGRVYFEREDGMADEPKVLSLGAYGDGMDFFTLKGAVEDLLASIRAENVTFEAVKDNPSYHPGRCARVLVNGQEVGVLGQIHPLVAQNYDVDAELYCAELSFPALYANKGADPQYVPLPKFPAVTRDIAVVCDEAVTVGQLEAAIRKGARGLLKEVELFDIYRGTNIPEGKKSVAFSLTLRADDRSLTAEEADADVKSILETLEQDCGAVLR